MRRNSVTEDKNNSKSSQDWSSNKRTPYKEEAAEIIEIMGALSDTVINAVLTSIAETVNL